eukprot:g47141.t1
MTLDKILRKAREMSPCGTCGGGGGAPHRPSCLYLGGGQVQAVVFFREKLKEDAEALLAFLRQRGVSLAIASGDRQSSTLHIGQQLGLDPASCRGGLSPAGKAAFVAELKQQR